MKKYSPAPRRLDLDTLQRAWEHLNSRFLTLESDINTINTALAAQVDTNTTDVTRLEAQTDTTVPEEPSAPGGGGGTDYISPGAPLTDFWGLDGDGFGRLTIGDHLIIGTYGPVPGVFEFPLVAGKNALGLGDFLLLQPEITGTTMDKARGIVVDIGNLGQVTVGGTGANYFGFNFPFTYNLQPDPGADLTYSLIFAAGPIICLEDGVLYSLFSATQSITGADGKALNSANIFGEGMHYRADGVNFRVNDHVSVFGETEFFTDNGGTLLCDLFEPMYYTKYFTGSGATTIHTERGAHFRSQISGTPTEIRTFVGVELDEHDVTDEEWSWKSHGEDAWFYNRGRAIFGLAPVIQTTTSGSAIGNNFIDVADASAFAASGLIRAGFNTFADDRYFRYTSISLGGGVAGSDRFNLDQDITQTIDGGTDVFQYTQPINAQVEIWGPNEDSSLTIHGGGSELLNLYDEDENQVFHFDSVGIPFGTIEGNDGSPSTSNLTNLDSVSVVSTHWIRIGTEVTLSGTFTADPTTTLLATSFEMALPEASNFTATDDAAGVAVSADGHSGQITASIANNTAVVSWTGVASTSAQDWTFQFTYRII